MANQPATRAAPRRALELLCRFTHQGGVHSAMSVNVSATGMYVRASHVPSAGDLLPITLLDSQDIQRVEVLGEVRWGQSEPTLETPHRGFGLQFVEIIANEEDLDNLIRLMDSFGEERAQEHVSVETRESVPLALMRFP